MCHIIESEYVLIHELMKKQRCTIEDLIISKKKIESSIEGVFVDVSRRSVETSVMCYSDYFSIEEDDVIVQTRSFEKLLKLTESRIKFSLREKLNKVF
ncbi:hypothetical protein GQR60_16895 [Labilibaculum sp. A4]|uniref:hypothetical protein n=1 Tax=Labilibaculum euxinus TaxID=2686357 RepID=UPI000F6167FA|nr:hypothetical protein [Labilibaculum euxinus]MDQ1772288.1 hypothetical protein [Labilibaculum euxinus]MWN78014.1 hypothetical protein [Labilibaculum euxinus]